MSNELVLSQSNVSPFDRNMAGNAAISQALIQTSYLMAHHNPRNMHKVRIEVLKAAEGPVLAKDGVTTRPVGRDKKTGKQKIYSGLSIRAMEVCIQSMGNILVLPDVVHEDDVRRTLLLRIIDTEKNVTYARPIVVDKIVERSYIPEGCDVLGRRENAEGQTVYIVRANEEETNRKVKAEISKAISAEAKRLIPVDLQSELYKKLVEVSTAGVRADPAKSLKDICDAFALLGVMPDEIERAMGHKLERITPQEIVELRGVHRSILDGETTWEKYASIDVTPVARAKVDLGAMKSVPPDEPEKPKKAKKEKDPEPPAQSPLDPITMYNELLAELTENGAAYVDQLMAEKFGTSRIKDIPPMLHADLAAWLDTELVKELQQENFLPMPG